MKNFNGFLAVASALAISLALSACGGGGGGGGGETSTSVPPKTGAGVAIITTPPPASSYSGEELAAYNSLNNARSTCGFGFLEQNLKIDNAASNHATWMINNALYQHAEVAGTKAFTGTGIFDRLLAAGFTWTDYSIYGEIMNETFSTNSLGYANKVGFGSGGIASLLSAPYHLAGAMGQEREMGVSVLSGGPVGSGSDIIVAGSSNVSYIVVDYAASGNFPKQVQAQNEVLTYPCQGISGTSWQLQGEIPNPIPSRDLNLNPIGQPIFAQAIQGNTLVISDVSVTGPLGSISLLPNMTSANDPNGHLTPNQVIVMPNTPLKPNTVYSVAIAGTNSGIPFTKIFNFSTGI